MGSARPKAPETGAPAATAPTRWMRRFKPLDISLYVLGQLMGPVMLLTLLLTSIIWMVTILPLLDLVINRGQSAPTFLYLILLMLPTPLMIILPIAFFFATLITLSRLAGDSELVVMASAGYSLRQLTRPVLAAAGLVMLVTWACALWLMPLGQRELRDKLVDIRADVAGALLNEGDFNTPSQGLTVFIRELGRTGDLRGILVHDNRDKKRPITYIAERGVLAQTPAGTRLIMEDGTFEQSEKGGAKLTVLHFERNTIDLDQFNGPIRATIRKTNERYLGELLFPSEPDVTPRARLQFFAEAHNRLAQPLYCIAFALIAMAAVMRGRRQRGKVAIRLTIASLAAIGLRIAGYGISGLAQGSPVLVLLFYLVPLLGAAAATAVLAGYSPRAMLERFRRTSGTVTA